MTLLCVARPEVRGAIEAAEAIILHQRAVSAYLRYCSERALTGKRVR
jgi:hypothetical protein